MTVLQNIFSHAEYPKQSYRIQSSFAPYSPTVGKVEVDLSKIIMQIEYNQVDNSDRFSVRVGSTRSLFILVVGAKALGWPSSMINV